MINKKIFFVFLLFSPAAFADVDYYTYGGFESVVNAFLRLAAIFGNSDYDGYIFAVAIAGVMVGYLVSLGKGFMAGGLKGYDAIVTLAVVIFGVTLYTVVIRPTTTVHIYDETTNQYQSVGGIPTLIANAVHLPNVLERGMTAIVDTSTVYTRSEHANGATLELLLNSLNGNPLSHNSYLKRSLHSYIETCMPPALNSNLYSFDLNEMMSNTSDLLVELSKIKSLSIPVVYYDLANKGGISVSCSSSYDSLAVILSSSATYNKYRAALCEKSGFDSTSAAQLAICHDRITEMSNLVFGVGVIGTDNKLFMSQAIAKTTFDVLNSYAGSAIADIANYREMSQGYGNVIVSEGWIPSIRSSTLVIILSILPILVLFLVTPMVFKSLHLIVTLFIFVGLWGVSDAIVHNIIVDQVGDLMSSLKTYNGSVSSFMMAPTDINKGLATFGKLQSMAVILAGFFAGVFFKLSSRAFSQMGERLADNVDSLGSNAGQQVLDPTQRMNMIEGSGISQEKYNQLNSYGGERYQQAVAGHNTQGVRAEQQFQQSMSDNKFDYNDTLDIRAQNQGGSEAGSTITTAGNAAAKNQSVSNYAQDTSSIRTGQALANTETDSKNIEYIGKEQNIDVRDAIQAKSDIDKSSQTGLYRADSSPENHIKAAETSSEIRLASSEIDNQNIENLQSELETDRQGGVDAFAGIHKSGETGQINSSARVSEHNTASTVAATQHLKDKLSYKAVTESLGKTVGGKAFADSTLSHEMTAGEVKAKKEFIKENETTAYELGERHKQTELESTEGQMQGREVAVNAGLAIDTQDAATKAAAGQDLDFNAQYDRNRAFSELSGKGVGQVYTDSNSHISQAMSKEQALQYQKAVDITPEEIAALYATANQLSKVANGTTDEITVPANFDGFDTLKGLGISDFTGGLDGAPFTAKVSQQDASNKLDLLNPSFVDFANNNKELIAATIGNEGSVTSYDISNTPSGNGASIIKKDTHAGDNITEKNQHTVEKGFRTDTQTIVDKTLGEEDSVEAIRYLELATQTEAALKNSTSEFSRHLFGHQEQRNSNEDTSSNSAIGRASLTLSKKAGADAVDQVGLSDNDKGKKGDGVLGKFANKIPADAALGGELTTSLNYSQAENSSSNVDVNQVRIAQILEEFKKAEDKHVAYKEFKEDMQALVDGDREFATKAESDHQVDAVTEELDKRGNGEKLMDLGADIYDGVSDFFVSDKNVDR